MKMFTAQPRAHHAPAAVRRSEWVAGALKSSGFSPKAMNNVPCPRSRQKQSIRAAIGSEDSKTSGAAPPRTAAEDGGRSEEAKAVISIRKKMEESFSEKFEEQRETLIDGIGRGILIQLISSDIDPVTSSGRSIESFVSGLPKPSDHPYIVEYAANFAVPLDFGTPGAVLITNFLDIEFYLVEVVVRSSEGLLFFSAHTWIHSRKDNPESRIIFNNKAYLPAHTPAGIKDLRREDLLSTRGNGKGERKMHERIYDYAVYNDLGNPDKSVDLARPTVGSHERPYPRRCRTGRGPMKTDSSCESRIEKPLPTYVPRDEAFNWIKPNTYSAALKQESTVGERLLKYDTPSNLKRDRFSWLQDNEFARQTLSGVNPVSIELLKEIPIMSKLDPAVYGPQESAITEELIEQELHGMTVETAMEEKRLFIIDYHDTLLPFIERMNALPGREAYASRAVFFYAQTGVLRPIVIELSLPPTPSSPRNKHIFVHGHDATTNWLWKLAKAHVCSNDAAIHQLVSHWLRTHACMEPYIIATHRQLSSMHPIYKLLRPHMLYTIEINAITRQGKVNAGGTIETSFSTGKYSMEVSSAAYKSMWRFDMEALPADLIRRGMAEEDPSMPGGVKLLIEDYPYAADGLLIWEAIKNMVESYVEYYYRDNASITSDLELQEWWNEIKNKGHYDKRHEPWWPGLEFQKDLSGILTIMIWMASGHHAVINFGQCPDRPTLMQKLIPEEGDPEYEKFLINPENTLLSSLPTQLEATNITLFQDTLLHQLHQVHSASTNEPDVLEMFEKFSAKLEDIESIINHRNKDTRLKIRNGAGVPPYELLLPSFGPGVTGRGIPSSISI